MCSFPFPFIYLRIDCCAGYIAVDGKTGVEPLMPPGMKELIRKDMDKSFEFAEGLPLDLVADSEKITSRGTSPSQKTAD